MVFVFLEGRVGFYGGVGALLRVIAADKRLVIRFGNVRLMRFHEY